MLAHRSVQIYLCLFFAAKLGGCGWNLSNSGSKEAGGSSKSASGARESKTTSKSLSVTSRIPPAKFSLVDTSMSGFKPDFGDPLAVVVANSQGAQGRLLGTATEDRINGQQSADRIFALGGDDFVTANQGNDFVDAGEGNDIVYGGQGSDEIYGQNGHDHLFGDLDNDKIFGGKGNDWLDGGPGDDDLNGGPGDDTYIIYPGSGSDTITEDSGPDLGGRDTVLCAGFVSQKLSIVRKSFEIQIFATEPSGISSLLATLKTKGATKKPGPEKWDIRCRNSDTDPLTGLAD